MDIKGKKTDWKEVELGEVCEIKRGETITKKQTTEGNVPVIAGGRQPAYYHNKSNRESPIITVSGSGDAGYVNFFNEPIFASDCLTIKPKNDGKLNIKFVYYVLKSRQNEIYKLRSGTTILHIYPRDLQKLKIFIPPLNIQNKIVSKLEKVEKTKKLREEAARLTDELLSTLMQQAFNVEVVERERETRWKEVELGWVCNQIKAGGTPIRSKPEYFKGKNLWVKIKDMDKNKKYLEDTGEKITDEAIQNSNAKLLPKGAVLISIFATLGEVSILEKEATTNQAIAGLIPDGKKVNTEYLYYVLKSKKKEIESLSRGMAQNNINLQILKNIKILLPPLPEQNKIVSKLEKVEKTKKLREEAARLTEHLFNFMSEKYLRPMNAYLDDMHRRGKMIQKTNSPIKKEEKK